MAIVILTLGELVSHIAMPALAGLLILIGYQTIKPDDLVAVWRTGPVQEGGDVGDVRADGHHPAAVRRARRGRVVARLARRAAVQLAHADPVGARERRHDPRDQSAGRLGEREIVVLQPSGSLFFAAAAQFDSALPAIDERPRHSVVIVRLRGHDDLGTTFIDVLSRYAKSLADVDSKLVIVSAGHRVRSQLAATGLRDLIGTENVYRGHRRLGAAVQDAYADARSWIASQPHDV